MKTKNKNLTRLVNVILILIFLLGFQIKPFAQSLTIYQYRHVPQEKMGEFIERETKYWSKVAENAITKGNLEFWALLQKVGGFDIPNSPNILFINTFKDIDNMEGIWDAAAVFPDVPMEKMETFSMGKVMHVFYVRTENFVQSSNASPDQDFNYIAMVYHKSSNPAQLIALEKEHWEPFIKSAMDGGKTTQVAWGNATILSPSGPDIKANTVSYDLYPSLKEALNTTLDENIVFPQEGLAEIGKLETEERIQYIYRIVKVVSAPDEN